MEWVAAAEEFMGAFGWGARGKHLGVSRMFGDGDKVSLSRNTWVVSRRPRGLISGFLVVLPSAAGSGTIVYVPAIAAKVSPQRLRMRLSPRVSESGGAIFSAYIARPAEHGGPRRCVLEDVLVWEGRDVWNTQPFRTRWNGIMKEFYDHHFLSDTRIQGGTVFEAANYSSVTATLLAGEPDERTVLEFVPDAAGQKRLIWIQRSVSVAPVPVAPVVAPPTVAKAETGGTMEPVRSTSNQFAVKKEAGMGPDVYAVFRGTERLGLALIRTLAVSRALRLAGIGEKPVPARIEFNKAFEKYEVLGL